MFEMNMMQNIMAGFVALRQNPSPSEASGDGTYALTQALALQVPAAQAKFVAARPIPPSTGPNHFIA